MDLSDFFSMSEGRLDQWSLLNTVARSWESAANSGRPTEEIRAEAASICSQLSPLEAFWAFPGPELMANLLARLDSEDAASFARLVQKTLSALLSESYRRDPGAWEPEEQAERPLAERMEAYATTQEAHRPY